MHNKLSNFHWQTEDEPQNMLTYIFLFVNLVYGIVFTCFPSSQTVTASVFSAHILPVEVWGAACLLLFILTVVSIYLRPPGISQLLGMAGVLVWGYGFWLYLSSGVVFAALVIYLPQMLFWSFWYIGVRRYYAKKKYRTEHPGFGDA